MCNFTLFFSEGLYKTNCTLIVKTGNFFQVCMNKPLLFGKSVQDQKLQESQYHLHLSAQANVFTEELVKGKKYLYLKQQHKV